jgi:hypothetical protein
VVGVTGSIGAPGDRDLFRILLPAGLALEVQAYAASQGSPLRPRLTLLDADGVTVLAQSVTPGTDERLVVRPPTGTVFLQVEDAVGQGGPGFFYTILVLPQ